MIVTDGSGAVSAERVLHALAMRAIGLSGADIEKLIRGARQSARRARRGLTWSDLDKQISASKPVRPEALRWRMAVHEAGHAVARLLLKLGTITLITIDGPDGGRVESEELLAEETENWLSSVLIAKLAGRAAEEMFLGSCVAGSGAGPGSDLATATTLALQMEASLGFSADQPLLYRYVEEKASLLIYRPEIAQRVNSRLERAYDGAMELMTSHRAAVEGLARSITAYGTLEGVGLRTQLGRIPVSGRPEMNGEPSAARLTVHTSVNDCDRSPRGGALASCQPGQANPLQPEVHRVAPIEAAGDNLKDRNLGAGIAHGT